MRGPIYIGASGWSYGVWRHGFYAGVPQARWLEHYARHFDAVEVNDSFYRLPERRTFEAWRDSTPPEFTFAIKGNRYVTHMKRLRDVADSVLMERDRARGLGTKLSVVVWQLPSNLKKDIALLEEFAGSLRSWTDARHAVEFRHTSWFDDEVASPMTRSGLAVCISDAASWPMWLRVTTDVAYVRLHGHEETYRSPYSEEDLHAWAGRAQTWSEEGGSVHVYFDNTDAGAAPDDALRLREILGV